MAGRVEVRGIGQLTATVRGYVARQVLAVKQHIARTVLNIRNEARRNAPVSAEAPRGQLKNSITAVLPVQEPVGIVTVLAPYGPFVEFGTGRRGAASNRQRLPQGYRHGPKPGMAARPFLRPALDAEQERFLAGMKQLRWKL